MSFLGKIWRIKNQGSDMNLIDTMMENRGLTTQDERYSFFNYNLNKLHDPFLLKDMQKAVDRLKDAVAKGEKIMIFGDYDVDGTSATALLCDMFQKIGANIHTTLPDREKDGYGMKGYFIEQFKKDEVDIIITVDCGTSNVKEIKLANELGMTVIVTDHHDAPAVLPEAYALINPKQPACGYPNKELSGSAVAYKLVCALAPFYFNGAQLDQYLYDQMGLAVLGLVADCMKLTGENRVMTSNGLKSLNQGNHPGIKAMLEEAGADTKAITSGTIGFLIGPRINAAGRLDTAQHALELLMGNANKVPILAELNLRRRTIVEDFVDQAAKQIEAMGTVPHVIVVSSKKWNAGTLGLIAGRMLERFSRPCIAMQEKENELVASCRSLNDFNITAFLRDEAGDLFINVGGHMLAGGFSIKKENREALEKVIEEKAPTYIDLDNFHGNLDIECEIDFNDLNLDMTEKISKFEPFGQGNPQPILLAKNITIESVRPVGKKKEHLQFPVQIGSKKVQAIAFRFGEHVDKITPDKRYDVVFNMEVNEWQGRKKLQLRVVDLKESD